MKNFFLVFVIVIVSLVACNSNDDEITIAEPSFITSDIDLFWQTFDEAENFSSGTFQDLYINQGTVGLKDYAVQKNLARDLQLTLKNDSYLSYYHSVRNNTLDVSGTIKISEVAFMDLKDIYPNTKFYNVYFLIGALNAGGRISNNGLLIAVEMFSKSDDTPVQGLGEWHQNVTRNKEYLSSVVVHEFIHMQQQFRPQNPGYRTTLEQSIAEGMADFVSHYLLKGKHFMNEHLHAYGDPLEEELWKEFESQMSLNYQETEWFYTGRTTSKGHPADMGYYMGFKILEAYSATFSNTREAIAAMLSTSNYYDIFERSGYASKFN